MKVDSNSIRVHDDGAIEFKADDHPWLTDLRAAIAALEGEILPPHWAGACEECRKMVRRAHEYKKRGIENATVSIASS